MYLIIENKPRLNDKNSVLTDSIENETKETEIKKEYNSAITSVDGNHYHSRNQKSAVNQKMGKKNVINNKDVTSDNSRDSSSDSSSDTTDT